MEHKKEAHWWRRRGNNGKPRHACCRLQRKHPSQRHLSWVVKAEPSPEDFFPRTFPISFPLWFAFPAKFKHMPHPHYFHLGACESSLPALPFFLVSNLSLPFKGVICIRCLLKQEGIRKWDVKCQRWVQMGTNSINFKSKCTAVG